MKIEKIRNFILEISPEHLKVPVDKAFEIYAQDPVGYTATYINHMIEDMLAYDEHKRHLVNGFLTGVFMANSGMDLEKMLEQFLEVRSKDRGENVINFFKRRK